MYRIEIFFEEGGFKGVEKKFIKQNKINDNENIVNKINHLIGAICGIKKY